MRHVFDTYHILITKTRDTHLIFKTGNFQIKFEGRVIFIIIENRITKIVNAIPDAFVKYATRPSR